uniref:Sushi domain-containing protein n=1 Tax=Scleropages formosus TaxID=113540 RepID=A0A8C9VYY9_SCLFO
MLCCGNIFPYIFRTILKECNMCTLFLGQTCGPLLKLENGDIVESNQMEVTYKCNRHFKLRGSSKARCINGRWSELPTCLHPCVVPAVIDARFNLQNIPETQYVEEGGHILLYCKSGAYIDRYHYGWGVCQNGVMLYPMWGLCFLSYAEKE